MNSSVVACVPKGTAVLWLAIILVEGLRVLILILILGWWAEITSNAERKHAICQLPNHMTFAHARPGYQDLYI
jgi:hypothetical protein